MRYYSDVLFGCKAEVRIMDFLVCLCTPTGAKAVLVPMCDPAAGEESDDSALV